ncbi:UNVERIFIED_CONTAM: hypothetical protein K2H54_041507 [Gekko kuhli]
MSDVQGMVALVPSDAMGKELLPWAHSNRPPTGKASPPWAHRSSKRNTATYHSAWDDGGREKGHFNCSGKGIATLAHREQEEGHSYLLLPNAPAKNYEGHRGPQLPTASALPSRRDDFTSATLPSRRHATIPSRRDDFMLCNAPQSEACNAPQLEG